MRNPQPIVVHRVRGFSLLIQFIMITFISYLIGFILASLIMYFLVSLCVIIQEIFRR